MSMAEQIAKIHEQLLQDMQSDCAGFGRLAVRKYATIGAWERAPWRETYQNAPLQVSVSLYLQEGD